MRRIVCSEEILTFDDVSGVLTLLGGGLGMHY